MDELIEYINQRMNYLKSELQYTDHSLRDEYEMKARLDELESLKLELEIK